MQIVLLFVIGGRELQENCKLENKSRDVRK